MGIEITDGQPKNIVAGNGIIVTESPTSYTISTAPTPVEEILVLAGLFETTTIFHTCGELEKPSIEITCESLQEGDIIQATLQQDATNSVCEAFYITAKVINGKAQIWLYGSMSWEVYRIYVTITRSQECTA